jgi:hypothetical protein
MKKNVNVTTRGQYSPSAFITKGRQRIKQYNDTVYLKNGDEFEIELFNPTQNKIRAEILLNGVSIGSGIVLRPGERVFLDRYLDEPKKFKFETYNVDMNDPAVLSAIINNGTVTIKFYKESFYITPDNINTWYNYVDFSTDFNKKTDTSYYNATASSILTNTPPVSSLSHGKIGNSITSPETGRIEKGSQSVQSLVYDYTLFNTWWTWRTEWKILPVSQKPFVKEDLTVYCTNCGAKRKKSSHRFCPHCGIKF